METITAKCTNIVQADGRGSVIFTVIVIAKDKKPGTQIAVSWADPKEAAKYEHGKSYEIAIKPVK